MNLAILDAKTPHISDILVVDDTPDNLRLLFSMLDEQGHKVRIAPNGKLALKSAQAMPPDLILLDIKMPGMNGYEVCEKLKADPRTRDIPVIFISALDQTDDKVQAFTFGGVDYITKPFQVEEVLARVETHLALYTLQNRLNSEIEIRTQELRQIQERMHRHERLAFLGQLAGGVSHELRNPLGVISNAVYYLNMVLPDADEQVREYLELIHTNTQEAERIITSLLDFARIKSVERSPARASELVAKVLSQHPPPDNVTLNLGIPEDLPLVYVDTRQINQVLVNLVTNAYQAMPGGGELTIENRELFHENSDTPMIALCIRDTGTGILPESLDKIFEPLFTTKARGIGLGLAISKMLVEANEGEIEVESIIGKSTTFTIYLPVNSEGI